jgi:hypothetical protein
MGLVDYGRLAWEKTSRTLEKVGDDAKKRAHTLEQFQSLWCSNEVFARWDTDQPKWNLIGPSFNMISEE